MLNAASFVDVGLYNVVCNGYVLQKTMQLVYFGTLRLKCLKSQIAVVTNMFQQMIVIMAVYIHTKQYLPMIFTKPLNIGFSVKSR